MRIVCFDLGGVLVRICRSWEEGCAAAGLELRGDHTRMANDPDRLAMVHALEVGELTPEAFFQRISESVRGVYSPEEIERVHHAWLLGEYPGVHDLVSALGQRDGVVTACLSNTNEAHWSALTQYDAIAALHHQHASHLLRRRKPDDDIYAAFERALGAAPEEILFFDDLPENVAAAQRRGWRAVRIDHDDCTATQINTHLGEHGLS